MTLRITPSLVAIAASFVGVLAWSSAARADVTPGCGGEGQPVCVSKPARSHGKARKVGCPAGSFFDPRNFGECWTCNGKVRTVHAVTSASACGAHVFDGGGTRAKFVRTLWGCNEGRFFDLVDGGSCWSCPAGTFRGLAHVKSSNACAVSPAAVCDAGMERAGNSCRPSRETQVRDEASQVVARHAADIARAIELALGLETDAGLQGALGGRDAGAIATVTASRAFRDATAALGFETVTVGAATSVSVGLVGGSAETGIAIDIDGKRPVYWYGGAGYDLGPGIGGDAGLSVGLWTARNDAIAGDAQGLVLSLSDLTSVGELVSEGLDFKPGASLAVAVWFSYPDEHGEIELQGITVTTGLSAGFDLGGYVRGTTFQLP